LADVKNVVGARRLCATAIAAGTQTPHLRGEGAHLLLRDGPKPPLLAPSNGVVVKPVKAP